MSASTTFTVRQALYYICHTSVSYITDDHSLTRSLPSLRPSFTHSQVDIDVATALAVACLQSVEIESKRLLRFDPLRLYVTDDDAAAAAANTGGASSITRGTNSSSSRDCRGHSIGGHTRKNKNNQGKDCEMYLLYHPRPPTDT